MLFLKIVIAFLREAFAQMRYPIENIHIYVFIHNVKRWIKTANTWTLYVG